MNGNVQTNVSLSGIVCGASPALMMHRTGSVSGPEHYYRSHAALKSNGRETGFHSAKSNRIIPLPAQGCRLLVPALNSYLNTGPYPDRTSVSPWMRRGQYMTAPMTGALYRKSNGLLFERTIDSFFQANCLLRDRMQSLVAELAGSGSQLRILPAAAVFSRWPAHRSLSRFTAATPPGQAYPKPGSTRPGPVFATPFLPDTQWTISTPGWCIMPY